MVTLGVWASRYREMQPITFGLGQNGIQNPKTRGSKAQANGSAEPGGSGRTGDEHVRGGSGDGRRGDRGVSYEMVPIKESEVEGHENV